MSMHASGTHFKENQSGCALTGDSFSAVAKSDCVKVFDCLNNLTPAALETQKRWVFSEFTFGNQSNPHFSGIGTKLESSRAFVRVRCLMRIICTRCILKLVLAMLIAAGISIAYHLLETRNLERRTTTKLKEITLFKANELNRWFRQRMAECVLMGTDGSLGDRVKEFIEAGDQSKTKENLLNHIKLLASTYQFSSITLCDLSGQSILSTDPHNATISSQTAEIINRVKSEGEWEASSLQSSSSGKKFYAFIDPIYGHTNPPELVAIAVLRIMVDEELAEIISSYETDYASLQLNLLYATDNECFFLIPSAKGATRYLMGEDPSSASELEPLLGLEMTESVTGKANGILYAASSTIAPQFYVVAEVKRTEINRPVLFKSIYLCGGLFVVFVLVILFTRLLELKTDEIQLLELEQQKLHYNQSIEQLSNNIPNGFVLRFTLHPEDGIHFQYISSGVKRIFNLESDQILANNSLLLAHIDRRWAASLRARLVQSAREMTAISEDVPFQMNGEEIWLKFNAQPSKAVDGRIMWDAVAVNISDHKETQSKLEEYRSDLENLVKIRTSELEKAKQQAETASKAKSFFLANMSHELRSPLHAIIGFAQLVANRERNVHQRSRITNIVNASKHLLAIINDLLDLTIIESKGLKLKEETFLICKVIEDVGDMMQGPANTKNIEFILDSDEQLQDLPLVGDPLRLRQILINFVGNALKFSETGAIMMKTRLVERYDQSVKLRLEVQDTGIGISPEESARIFEPFIQGEDSNKHKFEGTGLGLAICQKLAHLMHGTVDLKSSLGKGSTFSLTLTLKLGQSTDLPIQHEAHAEILKRSAHVLLVEDNKLNQEVAREILEEFNFIVHIANNGQEACTMMDSNRYEIILMDLQMPVMNGLEATRTIRRMPGGAEIPIIAMTANAMEEDRDRCKKAGMSGFLSKPVEIVDLVSTLYKWIPEAEDETITATPAEQLTSDS